MKIVEKISAIFFATVSIPFDGAIEPSTVNNNTVLLIRIADTLELGGSKS